MHNQSKRISNFLSGAVCGLLFLFNGAIAQAADHHDHEKPVPHPALLWLQYIHASKERGTPRHEHPREGPSRGRQRLRHAVCGSGYASIRPSCSIIAPRSQIARSETTRPSASLMIVVPFTFTSRPVAR